MSDVTRKVGLLDRLKNGEVIIGDGGYVIALEKRGYVKAGPWTPEAAVENPEAVEQLHREFIRCGSDVIQAFTFYSSDDKLSFKGTKHKDEITCTSINNAACAVAHKVAASQGNGSILIAGSISTNPAYLLGKGKEYHQAETRKQLQLFMKNNVDLIICEFVDYVEEMEWIIEETKTTGLPIVSTLSIGEEGDVAGVPLGECAVRMAKAGADVVGVNCLFDPVMTMKNIKTIKQSLNEANLHPFLITQPNGFFTTGVGVKGYFECPEFPFAMEPRIITRFDVHKYAREAYELGVRYIGGCCGFEPYHIRAIAEELQKERNGLLPPASAKHEPWGGALSVSIFESQRLRANREYWEKMVPHSGRSQRPTYPLPNE